MKKVMVYAYTKFNLGDDLFIKILCERYPKTKFFLYAPRKYQLCFKDMSNIKIIPSDSFINRGINFLFKTIKVNYFIRKLLAKRCDAAVHIGGSLFIQREDWEKELENKKSMLIESKPFFLLGANFGPFSNRDFYLQYKDVFKEYTDICFRENHSYEMFNDLSNVRMADDVIFNLKRKQELYQSKNNIVISVIKPSIRKHLANCDDIYYKKIMDITMYFIKKGYKVTLMSFCENEGDKEAIAEIMDIIPKEYLINVTSHFYNLNLEQSLNIIAASNFVVATRFHAMILGWVYNKPVFPIVYSDKMTNVMSDIGFKGSYTKLNNINSLNPEEVFKSMKTNLIDISKQVENSEKQFGKLDEYLLSTNE